MNLDYLRDHPVLVVGDSRAAFRRACTLRAVGAHVSVIAREGAWAFDTHALSGLVRELELEPHVLHAPVREEFSQITLCHAGLLAHSARLSRVVNEPRLTAMTRHPAGAKIDWEGLIQQAWLVEIITDDEDFAAEWLERAGSYNRPVARRSEPRPVDITLVGGGPGGAELITAAGQRALEDADVVFIDRLGPGREVPSLAPAAVVIDVGKTPGHHRIPQERIESLMLRFAAQGARVVRLKGGDPFVFGRGGEELATAAAAGYSVASIPGITSAIAVPAAVGIPVTHRSATRAFTVISGHEPLSDAECQGLVATGGTIVVLMGVGNLEPIARGLLQHGKPADTPVAIIENGYSAQQREVRATLGTVTSVAAREHVRNPAVIVIGHVINEAVDISLEASQDSKNELKSTDKTNFTTAKLHSMETRESDADVLPLLRGYRIAVTADRRSSEQIDAFRRRGATVQHIPTMRIVPVDDDQQLHSDTDAIIAAQPDLVLVTTAQGLTGWLDAIDGPPDAPEGDVSACPQPQRLHAALARADILVRGPKARGGVRNRGLVDAGVATEETTASLIDLALEWAEKRPGIQTEIKSDKQAQRSLTIALQLHGYADEAQIARLTDAGHRVLRVAPYRWQGPPEPQAVDNLIQAIIARQVHAVTFTAAPAAASLLRAARASGQMEGLREALAHDVMAAAVGPVTAEPLQRADVRVTFPARHRLGALIKHVSDGLRREHLPDPETA